jgi:hypothetical protein
MPEIRAMVRESQITALGVTQSPPESRYMAWSERARGRSTAAFAPGPTFQTARPLPLVRERPRWSNTYQSGPESSCVGPPDRYFRSVIFLRRLSPPAASRAK